MRRLVAASLIIGSAFITRKHEKPKKKSGASEFAKSRANIKFHHPFTASTFSGKLDIPRFDLTSVILYRLALSGCNSFLSYSKFLQSNAHSSSISTIEKSLRKLYIDDDWSETVRWMTSHIYIDADVICQDEFLESRPLQELRLNRLLVKLLEKVEIGYGSELVSQGILDVLSDLCDCFTDTNRTIFINSLKILASLALQNQECAAAVIKSAWFPRLAWMNATDSVEENILATKVCLNGLSTFSGNRHYGRNVYELYCSKDEPVIDLIFIHGLNGGVFWTWREKDDPLKISRTKCWPKTWLPKDIDVPFRVLAVDYPSSLTQVLDSYDDTLVSRADHFIKQLESADVGSRPLMLICHSIGGLLAKKILLEKNCFLKQTKGVLFIATPHRGTPLANNARFLVLPSNDVHLLNQKNIINKKLHEDFLRICDEIPVIYSMIETLEAPLMFYQKGFIVPYESAFFGKGRLYHIRDVHHNICKPSSRNDTVYGVILQFIKEVLYIVVKSGQMEISKHCCRKRRNNNIGKPGSQ